MSDPLRTDAAGPFEAGSDADREAKIEQLLLAGLEHYFAARHEQAINVWTRALFLDRSHARARAYIDRARGALAERQREAEEWLQNGVAAFERGDAEEARRLLHAAIEHGAPSEDAQRLVDRLNRLEQIVPAPADVIRPRSRKSAAVVVLARRGSRAAWIALAGLGLVIVVAGAFVAGALRSEWNSLIDGPTAPAPVHSVSDESLPLPRRGEMAMTRARALVATGRLRDALAVLDRVRATDPQKADADRLRADVQRQLLAMAAINSPAPPDPGATPRP